MKGAGWDPGALSLFRGLFALLTPTGHTEITRSPGTRLHHTTIAQAIPGIKRALSSELRTAINFTAVGVRDRLAASHPNRLRAVEAVCRIADCLSCDFGADF